MCYSHHWLYQSLHRTRRHWKVQSLQSAYRTDHFPFLFFLPHGHLYISISDFWREKNNCLELQVHSLQNTLMHGYCYYLLNNITGNQELKKVGLIFNTAINWLCNGNISLYTSLFIYETSVKHLKNLRWEMQCKCKALPRNNL